MAFAERDQPLILVVEDDPDAAQIAEHMLEALGCHTAIAANAMQGLFLLKEGRPDLVLLDISLPDMDGVAFLDSAAKMREAKGVPFVVASAIYASDSPMTRSLRERGVWRFLEKPFSSRQLETALRQVLPGWKPTSPVLPDTAGASLGEGSTMEFDIGELAIHSLAGMKAIDQTDIDAGVPAATVEQEFEDEDPSQLDIVVDSAADDNIGEMIGPLHASVLRDDARLDADIVGIQAEGVVIQTAQIQPRPGDLVRLELRARMIGFDQEIHHISVLLLTRVANIQRRGVTWEIGLLVQMAKPDDLWPKIGDVWRPPS